MYSKQGEFVCMLKSVCMYACMYMYDVLVEIGVRGRREGFKVSNKHEEGESTSLA